MSRPKSTPISRSRKIPLQYPSYTPFTKKHTDKPLPYTQPITRPFIPSTLLPLAPHLLHITHGLYQYTVASTRVTLYSSSRLNPTSGSIPGCSRIYSRAQGLRRDSYPANSHSLSLLFISASTQHRLYRRPLVHLTQLYEEMTQV